LEYQEKSMNRSSLLVYGALAAAAAVFAPANSAKAVTYCLVGEMNECRFVSLEQCLQAMNGVAGYCVVDSQDIDAPGRIRHR
jgi:hypothetical protein